jgi:hypothetical protein
MCFGGGGAAQEESNKAAAEERVEADVAKRDEVEERAKRKRDDISEAITERVQQRGMRGGRGRRSLFRSGGGGFMGRFGG